jgi:hypothetical protein
MRTEGGRGGAENRHAWGKVKVGTGEGSRTQGCWKEFYPQGGLALAQVSQLVSTTAPAQVPGGMLGALCLH